MKHASKSWYRVTAHVLAPGEASTFAEEWIGEAFTSEHAVFLAGQNAESDNFPLTVEVEDWQDPEAES
jgi:hypothetical protein